MLRRKGKASATAPGTAATATAEREAEPVPDDDPTMVDTAAEPTAVAEPVAAEPEAAEPELERQPEPQPAASGGERDEYSVTRYLDLGDLFTTPRNASEEERERMAAAEFQAAIAPAFQGLDEPPPLPASPDEAVRQFVEKTGEARPDPGAASSNDIYKNEASAYYRIRKHFAKGIGRTGGPWTPPPGLTGRDL